MTRLQLRQLIVGVLVVLLVLIGLGFARTSFGRGDSPGNRPPVPSPAP